MQNQTIERSADGKDERKKVVRSFCLCCKKTKGELELSKTIIQKVIICEQCFIDNTSWTSIPLENGLPFFLDKAIINTF